MLSALRSAGSVKPISSASEAAPQAAGLAVQRVLLDRVRQRTLVGHRERDADDPRLQTADVVMGDGAGARQREVIELESFDGGCPAAIGAPHAFLLGVLNCQRPPVRIAS